MKKWDALPFKVNMPALLTTLGISPEEELFEELLALVKEAERIARPKGALRSVPILRETGRVSAIGEVKVKSPLLDTALLSCQNAVVFLCTCGKELESLDTGGDPLAAYWLDAIEMQAVYMAMRHLQKEAERILPAEKTAVLNPGSLPGWPLEAQRDIFSLLGNMPDSIGVVLEESLLMRPLKSISGLFYKSDIVYENCMLCRRGHCLARRAPFNEDMAAQYGESVCQMQL